MARGGATILGLARLQKKLDRMPKVAKETIRKRMAEAAEDIVRMMKSLARDPAIVASIGWTWGAAPKGSRVVAVAKGAGLGGDLTITIYAGDDDAFYVWWWEFGTAERVQKTTGRKTGRMPANPFFFVSWRANRKSARRKVRAGVREAMRQVAASN